MKRISRGAVHTGEAAERGHGMREVAGRAARRRQLARLHVRLRQSHDNANATLILQHR